MWASKGWTRIGVVSPARAVLMVLVVLAGLAALGGALASPARADATEQSILMDDYAFIYSSPSQVQQNLEQVAALGVTTIKVSMVWSLVAPEASSTTAPSFDATDPDAYPAGAWQRYDTLVSAAEQLGLRVYFQITGPAPLWAANPHTTGNEHNWSHDVNPTDFGQFVEAVGERYSGSYPIAGDGDSSDAGTTVTTPASLPPTDVPVATSLTTPGPASTTPDTTTDTTPTPTSTTPDSTTDTTTTPTSTTPTPPTPVGPLDVLGVPARDSASSPSTTDGDLPAVTEWGLWNEPNEIGWLSPQSVRVGRSTAVESAVIYRQMFDAGYTALLGSGHGLDTILLGETASEGNTHEMTFVQDLYCVNADDVPMTGAAAALEDCPQNRATFIAENPGLFTASGYATHPYGFSIPPNETFKRSPATITMANLGVLERGLDAIDRSYGEPTGMPIYVSEWGYKTDPPNPDVGTNLAEQETWLDEGWYMSSLMPRVRSMAQELLYDQPPVANTLPGTAAYWANFDSGLEFEDGDPKPAYAAFRLPIWLPQARTGPSVALWAEIRPASVTGNDVAELQYAAPGSSTWTNLTLLSTTNPDGFIETRVAIPHRGIIRIAWGDPVTGEIDYSRTVPIS